MKKKGRTAIFSAISIIVLLIVFFFARGPIQKGLSFFQYPFSFAGTWISNNIAFISFGSAEEIELLKNQRNSCIVDQTELEHLKRENEQLKDQLLFAERTNKKYVSARIINRAFSDYSSSFVIDRGSQDGITNGVPVMVDSGIMIGKVIATNPSTSTVASITDQDNATAVALINKTNTIGIAKGTIGDLIKLQFIPQDEKIAVNDLVVTSGIEDNIPSGLIVGIVNHVSGEPTDPFKEAIIEPLLDSRHRHIVTVLISEKQP